MGNPHQKPNQPSLLTSEDALIRTAKPRSGAIALAAVVARSPWSSETNQARKLLFVSAITTLLLKGAFIEVVKLGEYELKLGSAGPTLAAIFTGYCVTAFALKGWVDLAAHTFVGSAKYERWTRIQKGLVEKSDQLIERLSKDSVDETTPAGKTRKRESDEHVALMADCNRILRRGLWASRLRNALDALFPVAFGIVAIICALR